MPKVRLGHLRELVAFDAPSQDADGYDNGWQECLRARAHFRYLRGGETVQAARLEGRQPVVVTIPDSPQAQKITSDWRMRDLLRQTTDADGDLTAGVYAVTAPPVLSDDRLWLEITCTSGVAA